MCDAPTLLQFAMPPCSLSAAAMLSVCLRRTLREQRGSKAGQRGASGDRRTTHWDVTAQEMLAGADTYIV